MDVRSYDSRAVNCKSIAMTLPMPALAVLTFRFVSRSPILFPPFIFIASASCVVDINDAERQPRIWLANNMPRRYAIATVMARVARSPWHRLCLRR